MVSKNRELAWIGSNGGPLLLLPVNLLGDWQGIDPPSEGRGVVAQFRWDDPGAPATDYDRACDVDTDLGLLDVGDGWGLVLGGEPLETTWYPDASGGGMLIRWNCGEEDADVIKAITNLRDDIWQGAVFFDVTSDKLRLFDAAYPGDRAEEFLDILLPVGRYLVSTARVEPDENASFLIHRLVRI